MAVLNAVMDRIICAAVESIALVVQAAASHVTLGFHMNQTFSFLVSTIECWANGHHLYSIWVTKTVYHMALFYSRELHLFQTWVTSANHSFGMYGKHRGDGPAVLTFTDILFCDSKEQLRPIQHWPVIETVGMYCEVGGVYLLQSFHVFKWLQVWLDGDTVYHYITLFKFWSRSVFHGFS